jgi:threonine synthase
MYAKCLKSVVSGKEFPLDSVEYTAPGEGEFAVMDVIYDLEKIQKPTEEDIRKRGLRGIWRYIDLLPNIVPSPKYMSPLLVGETPLVGPLASTFCKENFKFDVYIKDDGRNPSGSLKDRASAVVLAKGLEMGRRITTASTGNAAAALAALGASLGEETIIFVPKSAPPAKIAQLAVYGAKVLLVDGTYDDAFDLCLEASRKFGWYNRSTAMNYFTIEGKKTVSFEFCEQLSGTPWMFEAPDAVFVSVGDGNIISGVHKGLKELLALGWISKMPRIFGIQATGSDFVYRCWKDGTSPLDMKPIKCTTLADSISAGTPRDPIRAVRAATETDGRIVCVRDEEILAAIPSLARSSGVFAEPAAAAAWAGLLRVVEDDPSAIPEGSKVVVIVTGNGLKDVRSAQESVSEGSPTTSFVKTVKTLEDVEGLFKEE